MKRPKLNKGIPTDAETKAVLRLISRQTGRFQNCIVRDLILAEAARLKIRNGQVKP